MKKYRHFDEEFKRDLVARIDSGEITASQACREHNLASSLVDRWKRQIHEGTPRSKPSAREKQLERGLEQYNEEGRGTEKGD
ncbi:MAG: transposase [Nitrospinae bacterium]|nr:transposase [Nitrospinota bacterium]